MQDRVNVIKKERKIALSEKQEGEDRKRGREKVESKEERN